MPAVRRPRRQDRHPDRPRAATTCPPARSSPSRARRGSSARSLKPGRYPYNPYAETIELHDPVTVPAGLPRRRHPARRPRAQGPQRLPGRADGERGVQTKTLEPGDLLPQPLRDPGQPGRLPVEAVQPRRRTARWTSSRPTGSRSRSTAPSSSGSCPSKVAEVFVKYNEDDNGDEIDEEIIAKIITPESRSLCRIGGSKLTGGQFISGDDREKFQRDLVKSLTENCKKQGIEILAVAITSIQPPEEIAEPVRAPRGRQAEARPVQPGEAPAALRGAAEGPGGPGRAEEEAGRGRAGGRREDDQGRAGAAGRRDPGRAEAQGRRRPSSRPPRTRPSAIVAKAQADADVIRFNNKAEVAGLAARVAAFDGDGSALARNILVGKLAPAFRSILSNSDGPLMDLFGQFTRDGRRPAPRGRRRRRRPRPPTPGRRRAELPARPVRLRGGPAMNRRDVGVGRRRSLAAAVAGLPRRLRRDLAVDDLPGRGPAGLQPAAPLQGPLAVRRRRRRRPRGRWSRPTPRAGRSRSASSRRCPAPAGTSTRRWSTSASWSRT